MTSVFRNTFLIVVTLFFLIQSALSEGDNNTEDVTVNELLSNPIKFNGKKLSIVGYYRIRFEGYRLADGHGSSLWLGKPSKHAKLSDIHEVHESWSRVIGTFIKGRSGHLGQYSGRIENITHVKALSGWTEFSPLGVKLEGIVISPRGNFALFVDNKGKGWTFKEGHFFPGIILKKIKQILKDRVILIEEFENYKGKEVREFQITLKNN